MKRTLFTLLALSLFTLSGNAKKLYKYQDAQGNWHFTDKAPKTKEKVEVRQLDANRKQYVWLEKTGNDKKPEYFVINNYKGPIELEVKLFKKNNVRSNPPLPKRFVLQPGQSDILFRLSAINKYKSWGYSFRYRYTIGDSKAKHDEQAEYLPPFAVTRQFRISQAFGGKFSHTDKQNKYAVDLAMPEQTPVHAARSGMVIEVNNDFFKNGTTRAFRDRANSIRILHADGSMAIYAHLALEKAQVYPGLQVYAGQLIGYSGNTGYSSGPHLHFAVQVNKGMSLESVPFTFTTSDDQVSEPIAGEWLIN